MPTSIQTVHPCSAFCEISDISQWENRITVSITGDDVPIHWRYVQMEDAYIVEDILLCPEAHWIGGLLASFKGVAPMPEPSRSPQSAFFGHGSQNGFLFVRTLVFSHRGLFHDRAAVMGNLEWSFLA